MTTEAERSIARSLKFPKEPSEWKDIPAIFEDGKLTIYGHPVMEDWEMPYMKELAAIACTNGGTILELGFGLGLSAGFIHSHPIEKHIVIEANADVFSTLTEFARSAEKPVEALFGLWQDVIHSIPDESVDGVLFDTYPLSADDIVNQYPFFVHAYRVLKKGGIFTYYSSEPTDFSPEHFAKLQSAGFSSIDKKICSVAPPDDCRYWEYQTILSPIIRK